MTVAKNAFHECRHKLHYLPLQAICLIELAMPLPIRRFGSAGYSPTFHHLQLHPIIHNHDEAPFFSRVRLTCRFVH